MANAAGGQANHSLSGAQILARLLGLGAVGVAFTDSAFAIIGSSDATKIARFEVDGLTTATTRVYTLPNASITVAGIDLAQTFTATQTFAGINATSIGAVTPGSGAFTTLGASGIASVTNNTASTSTTTGALIVTGGVGIGGALIVGGQASFAGTPNANACLTIGASAPAAISGTTEYGMFIDFRSDSSATANTRAAFYRAGTSAAAYTSAVVAGIVVGNSILGAGSAITRGYGINVSPQSSATNNYAIVHSTGTPNTGNYFLYDDAGYASRVSGVWTHTDTTTSSSTSTGALVVGNGSAGGLGVGGDAYIGATLNVTGATAMAGALTVSLSTATLISAISTSASASGAGGFLRVACDDGAALASGDRLGGVLFAGSRDAAHAINSSGGIAVFATEAFSGTTCGAKMVWSVTPNGATARSDRLTLDQDGSFIVGTDPGGANLLRVGGALTVSSTTMIATKTSFTNGAGAFTGTLTNSPATGNPTKWIPVDDNGTTRLIPAW